MEGQIYEITNFYTQKPRPVSKYKIVDHEAELCFDESTKFQVGKDTFPPIPQYSFHVLEFDQFGAQVKTQEVLIDVYGCIKSVLPEHQVNVKDSTKLESKCEVFIENLRFSKPGDKVKILPVPFKRPIAEELKNQTTKSVFELNTLNPDSYVNHSVYCTASILRFPAYSGWLYRGCSSCSRVLKVKEDSGEFLCPKPDVQIPLPCYNVYVTIHDHYNQATVTLMGKQEQQLSSISC
ncbi:uncharacterized protein LOC133722952 [Rosa rugosa]|uniref:uncharacterized protein LOC133722952 n=1 Tax=Rosa rugosa TaxID=74645 RepID=UPI002B40B09E|nr:uncharacterized protein LOC133722952 [Rosa rugosa]XP_062005783.1 uncharacterized protein LOC133722952 [Rosa rugosa]XP_062005788.1 uncharacterized protein LOC133722952 [Rosa rugosa]